MFDRYIQLTKCNTNIAKMTHSMLELATKINCPVHIAHTWTGRDIPLIFVCLIYIPIPMISNVQMF